MRTMKKALCFVLAMIFVLGLCTIGAGAFSDDAKVTYTNAVNVMAGLGIIKGDDNDGDGNLEFRPKDTITRAEAAVIIARMILGDNYDKLPKAGTSFADVGPGMSEWAQPAIAFCEARGIVNGRGDGKFYPQDNVTGIEMVKMLLCANGHGGDGQFTGKGWSINVFTEATTNKIFKNVADSVDFEAPATREQCALYTLNTMQNVKELTLDSKGNVVEGSTLGEKVWSMKTVKGQVWYNQATSKDYKGYVVIYPRQADGSFGGTPMKFKYDFESDEAARNVIGHEVSIAYNADVAEDAKYYDAYQLEDISKIISAGTYFNDYYKNLVAENADNADIVTSKICFWDNYVYVDHSSDTSSWNTFATFGVNKLGDFKGSNATYSFYISGSLVAGEDGKVIAYMTSSSKTVGIVTSVTADGVKLTTTTPYSPSGPYGPTTYPTTVDPTIYTEYYDGIKVDDIVILQTVGERTVLLPTTTKEMTISRIDSTIFGTNYTDGTTTLSASSSKTEGLPGALPFSSIAVKNSYKFYLDSKNAIVMVTAVDVAAGNVYFVNNKYTKAGAQDQYGQNDNTAYYQMVDANGNEVNLPKSSSTDWVGPDFSGRGSYEVTINSKGYVTGLKLTANQTYGKDNGKSSFLKIGSDKTYYIDSDTSIYFVNEKASTNTVKALKITTGALPSTLNVGTEVYAAIVANSSGSGSKVKTVWVFNQSADPSSDTSKILFLSTKSSSGSDVNGSFYTEYINDVSTSELHIDNVASGTVGQFYTYTVDADGIYTLEAYTGRRVENHLLQKGDIANGRLYFEADGVELTNKIVFLNYLQVYTADYKNFLTINSFADLEALVNDGWQITVSYLRNSKGAPTGTFYIVGSPVAP